MWRTALTIIICAALLTPLLPLTAQAWDFHSVEERPTRDTAYTLAARQKRLLVGIYGTHFENVLGVIGIAYAPFKFWELQTNIAHFGAGIFNIGTKFNLLDHKRAALGVTAGFAFIHGKFLWALPQWQKSLVQGLNVYIVPLTLIASTDLTRWLHFDFTVGYDHAQATGYYSGTRLFLDGYLGAQQLYLLPILRFYLAERVSINASARLPLWGRVIHEVESEVNIGSGIRGGVRSAGYTTLDPLYYWLVTLGVQVEVVTQLYITLDLSVGPYTETVYRRQVSLGADLEWRF